MAYSAKDKDEIVNYVCKQVAARKTVASALKAKSVDRTIFYDWLNENQQYQQLYKKARDEAHEAHEEYLKDIVPTAFELLLTGLPAKEYDDVETTEIWKPDESGNLRLVERKVTPKKIRVYPNAPCAIFGMKNKFGWHDGQNNGSNAEAKDRALGEAVDESVLFKSTDND